MTPPRPAPTEADLLALVDAARLAPSADNHPVFEWHADGDRLRLWPRPRRHAVQGHQGLLDEVSLGAASVNLEAEAAARGWVLDAHWGPLGAAETPVAELRLRPRQPAIGGAAAGPAADDQPPVADLAPWLATRCSNRRLRFNGPRLGADDQALLARQAAADGSARLAWLDAPASRRAALQALRLAEQQRFQHRALHQELYEAMAFEPQPEDQRDEGLPMAVLGLSGPEALGFKALRHWPLQRLANLTGTHLVSALRSVDLPCRHAPHLLAIVPAAGSARPAFDAGRALQRVWLQATGLGLAVQVYAAGALYAQGLSPVPAPVVQRLRACWRQALGDDVLPMLALRLGRAPAPDARTARAPRERLHRHA